jgi:hypothetical protein
MPKDAPVAFMKINARRGLSLPGRLLCAWKSAAGYAMIFVISAIAE